MWLGRFSEIKKKKDIEKFSGVFVTDKMNYKHQKKSESN